MSTPAASKKFVCTGPGHTAVTVMPLPRSSSDSPSLNARIHALCALYVPAPVSDATEETLMMAPRPRARMAFSAA